METCPYCDGFGVCYDESKTCYKSLSPVYEKCPVCYGQGKVSEKTLENIDCDKSVQEFIKENKDAARFAQWEFEQTF